MSRLGCSAEGTELQLKLAHFHFQVFGISDNMFMMFVMIQQGGSKPFKSVSARHVTALRFTWDVSRFGCSVSVMLTSLFLEKCGGGSV